MTKLLALLVTLCLITLVACTDKQSQPEEKQKEPPQEVIIEEDTGEEEEIEIIENDSILEEQWEHDFLGVAKEIIQEYNNGEHDTPPENSDIVFSKKPDDLQLPTNLEKQDITVSFHPVMGFYTISFLSADKGYNIDVFATNFEAEGTQIFISIGTEFTKI